MNLFARGTKAKATAATRGVDIQVPAPSQAFIDIDSAEALAIFEHRWAIFHATEPDASFEKRASPSGKPGHWHVIVSLARSVCTLERLLIQATLGDDPMRMLISYRRFRAGDPSPSILFKVKP